MSNRWIRFLLAVLALAAAAGAGYRIVQDERTIAHDINTSRAAASAADTAVAAVADLKATLHAYAAPGQGIDFWAARSKLLLDKLRSALLELDVAANAAGVSVGESLDASDRLAAAEQRAQSYIRSDQPLLAGEIVFREARDLLDSLRLNIVRVRDQLASAALQRQAPYRQEQLYLVGGAIGVLALVMLLLVPIGQPQPVMISDPSRPLSVTAAGGDDDAVVSHAAPPRAAPAVVIPPVSAAFDLAPVAALCAEIASVSNANELETLVDTARRLLDARGIIVWVVTPDRVELQPVAASGYEPRVLARLGSISLQTDNLTSRAFRDASIHTSDVNEHSAAALAIPLPSPAGPAGVFSAEFPSGSALDAYRIEVARIVASQLGCVLGSTAAAVEPNPATQVQEG